MRNALSSYFKKKSALEYDEENFGILSDEEREDSSERHTVNTARELKSRREYLLVRRNIRNNAFMNGPSEPKTE